MIFNPQIYFYGSKKNQDLSDIHSYNSAFKNGILICPNLLYYLVIGSYSKNLGTIQKEGIERFALNNMEAINYEALTKLLDSVRINIGAIPLFITPHTFTKFTHLLWDRKMDTNHHKQILDLFRDEFGYIQEEEIRRNEILDLDNFRHKILGISETALVILKNRKKYPCIISANKKIWNEYKEDFLYVDFNELVAFVKEEERKQEII